MCLQNCVSSGHEQNRSPSGSSKSTAYVLPDPECTLYVWSPCWPFSAWRNSLSARPTRVSTWPFDTSPFSAVVVEFVLA